MVSTYQDYLLSCHIGYAVRNFEASLSTLRGINIDSLEPSAYYNMH